MGRKKAIKTVINGIPFDSLTESRRYLFLLEQMKVGEISDLKLQVEHEIQPEYMKLGKRVLPITYTSDFEYYDEVEGIYVIEDVKGKPDELDNYKRKIFEYLNRNGINRREMIFKWIVEAPKHMGVEWTTYKEYRKAVARRKREAKKEQKFKSM